MVSLDPELQYRALKIFIEEIFRFYGADPAGGHQAGAISFTQRYGAALNLHVHFHVVAIDGLYVRPPDTDLSFIPARTPSPNDVREVAYRVHDRFIGHLIRIGRIDGDHPIFDDPSTWPVVDRSGQSGWLHGDEAVPDRRGNDRRVRAENRPTFPPSGLHAHILYRSSEATVARFRDMTVEPGIRTELHAIARADIELVREHEAFAKVLVNEYVRNRDETRPWSMRATLRS